MQQIMKLVDLVSSFITYLSRIFSLLYLLGLLFQVFFLAKIMTPPFQTVVLIIDCCIEYILTVKILLFHCLLHCVHFNTQDED
jgi:hypothetical protein